MRPRRFNFALALPGLCALCATAHAQDYPARPVRIVVPFPPGGGVDFLARLLSQRLTETLGVSFVIENRGGAGGTIGADVVAKSRNDGYTLLAVSASHAINVSLYPKLPYDTVRDFAPISMLVGGPNYLVVHPSLPVKSVKELVALARSRPGVLTYASAGNGTPPHLGGELFKSLASVNLVHIPYKGNGMAYTDLLAGQVPVMFPNVSTATPFVKSARLRALAVTSKTRTKIAPELPTMDEAGVPGYELNSWYGLLAPAGTPAAIINRLQQEVARAYQVAEIRDKLTAQGLEPLATTPAEFAAAINTEISKWAQVIKTSGTRVD